MYIFTGDKLIDLSTGNMVLIDGNRVVLKTRDDEITLGESDNPQSAIEDIATVMTLSNIPVYRMRGVKK